MRLVHLSDIHLSDKNIDELRYPYRDSLIEDLKDLQEQDGTEIDIIAITGDLLDRGGHSLKNIYKTQFENSYDFFEHEFIKPLKKGLNLENHNFIFIPGNHDVDETDIRWIEEKRLKKLNAKGINDELEKIKDNFTPVNFRIKAFKEFEKSFHSGNSYYQCTNNESTYIYKKKNGQTVGFILVNDSWRSSTCILEDEYKEGLNDHYFGAKQLSRGYDRISDSTDLNICLFHHSLDELAEKDDITSFLLKEQIPIFLYGHKHDISNESPTNVYEKNNVLGFRPRAALNKVEEKELKYMSGYQVFDFSTLPEKKSKITFRRYNKGKNTRFVADTGDWSAVGSEKIEVYLKAIKNPQFDYEGLEKRNFIDPKDFL